MDNIEKLANLGGTVTTVVIFIWYLREQGKLFNQTINNYLVHSTKVIEKNNEAMLKVNITLKELCLALKKENNGNKR